MHINHQVELDAIVTEQLTRLEKVLRFLRMDVCNPHLLAEAADLNLSIGQFDAAFDLVQQLLIIQPDNPVARYQKAYILLSQGKVEAALSISQSLISEGLNQPALLFTHAWGLVLSGQFADAEPFLENLITHTEEFPRVPHLYIRTLHAQGRMEEAIAYTASYMERLPDDDIAAGMCSLLYLDHDDIVRAGELASAVLLKSPDNIDALLAAGTVALANEEPTQAKAHFDKVLGLYGDHGRAWVGIGMLNLRDANLVQAELDLRKAVTCMPTHLGSYNALSWAQILQDDYAGARRTLKTCLEVDRNFAETHGTLAVVAALEGDCKEANRLAEIALRLDPLSFSGRYAQSLVISQEGDPKHAQTMVASMVGDMRAPNGGSLGEMLQRAALRR